MNRMHTQKHLEGIELSAGDIERLAGVFPLRNELDYSQAVALVDRLMEQVVEDRAHPLRGAMCLLVEQVRQYDELHHRLPEPAPHELIEFLMEQREIGVADMKSIADAEILSAVIAGTRPVDAALALRLGEFFHVAAELFASPKPARS